MGAFVTSLFYCMAYPANKSFLFSFILIIFFEKRLLKIISFRLKLKTQYNYRTSIHYVEKWNPQGILDYLAE